ncbi:MAG TPA: MT-A70 family methyltransferase [Thermomicrobiales bacterium]|nr:MT-A70 family methyltransferase [Thermomicrobiales bacterium]
MGALPSGGSGQFGALLADPPWRFANRTGKMAPEHRRLSRYATMTLDEIAALPVADLALPRSHLYLWVPNALVLEGLEVLRRWGFTYKTNLVWYKTRKDGGPDGRGVGFYFRNVTELILFGTRGNLRTLPPGRRQVNLLAGRKREHSRKPDGLYEIIEACSPGPYLELFARHCRPGWTQWGNEIDPAQLALAPLALDTPPKRESRTRARNEARPDQLALDGHAGEEGHRDDD